MEKYKIYLYSKLIGNTTDGRIVITDSAAISEASTFDESISVEENDKVTITFSIYEKMSDGEENPFIEYLVPEAVLGLELPNRERNTASPNQEGAYYKLKIVERSPSFSEENVQYNITAIDYARAVYSKQAEGLTIEKTGSLRDISEEILGETRKNTIYKDLSTDISKIYLEQGWLDSLKDVGVAYSLPYINFKDTTMEYFRNNPIAKFYANDKLKNGEKYEIQFEVVAARVTDSTVESVDFDFGVTGKTASGSTTFSEVNGRVINFDKTVSVRSEFTYVKNSSSLTDSLELYFYEIQDLSKGDPWQEFGTFEISLSNIRITKSRKATETRGDDTALRINHLDNFKQFQLPEQGKNIDIRMTFSVSNSNLYKSLVSLATLFEAEVKFDYLENAIYFVSKKFRQYKGYRLDPTINLNSISRPENSNEFATIFHVEGSGDIDGIIPTVPKEWRRYLSESVDENFKNEDFFRTYNQSNTYVSKIEKVANYIDKSDSTSERIHEITKFAEHMDKVPNFESTLYDFSYFERIGLLEDDYPLLVNLINNTIRKLNISLNINTYRYYTIYSEFATQLQQVAFYSNLINVEEKFKYNTEMKLNGADAPEKYTSSWVGYMNAIDSASANIVSFTEELERVVGFHSPGFLDPGSFVHNACMLFGYQNKDNNGIQQLLSENVDKIREKEQEKRDLEETIAELELQLEDSNVTSYIKESISVEVAGHRSRIESINNFIGRSSPYSNSFRGSYMIENSIYTRIIERMGENSVNIPQNLIDQNISLFKLLFDRENPHNLVIKKEKELEILMDKYEAFALEARYQNNDEVTSEGLLEQGLLTFVKFNRPRVSYNISAIHIGALQDYSFIEHPEIGDKIRIDENLYLSYEEEDTDYLVIVGYKEKLREPQSLELQVEKDDESELLVRRMIEQTNFIQFNKGKTASNTSVPVPRELSSSIDSVSDSIAELHETGLSVVSLFDEMIKK